MMGDPSFKLWLVAMGVAGTAVYLWLAYRVVMRRRYPRSRGFSDVASKLLPVAITTLAGMVAVLALAQWSFRGTDTVLTREVRIDGGVAILAQRLEAVEKQLQTVQASLPAVVPGAASDTQQPSSVALTQMETKLNENSQAIAKFQQLFLSEPERLITLPLLQRDLQGLKDDLATAKENVKGLSALVTETNGQNRWVIGTLALGMLALVVPAVRSLFPSGGSRGEDAKTKKVPADQA
jgi:hypothetical protein